MSDSLIDKVGALIREVAATYILPRFRSLSSNEVDTKSGPEDLVTIADREAEFALAPRLKALVPGSVVVGEEGVAADRSVLDRLATEDDVWLVDPVDGTANFVQGSPQFGVMVARIHKGETVEGWIYTPIEGVMATAQKGAGATANGEALSGRKAIPFAKSFGDYSSKYVQQPLRQQYTELFTGAGGTRQGHCSAYAYLDTARGQLDFVLQFLMSPWDHAPGILLVNEAGGAVRFLDDGSPYTPIARVPRPMLATSDKEMWTDYAARLNV